MRKERKVKWSAFAHTCKFASSSMMPCVCKPSHTSRDDLIRQSLRREKPPSVMIIITVYFGFLFSFMMSLECSEVVRNRRSGDSLSHHASADRLRLHLVPRLGHQRHSCGQQRFHSQRPGHHADAYAARTNAAAAEFCAAKLSADATSRRSPDGPIRTVWSDAGQHGSIDGIRHAAPVAAAAASSIADPNAATR